MIIGNIKPCVNDKFTLHTQPLHTRTEILRDSTACLYAHKVVHTYILLTLCTYCRTLDVANNTLTETINDFVKEMNSHLNITRGSLNCGDCLYNSHILCNYPLKRLCLLKASCVSQGSWAQMHGVTLNPAQTWCITLIKSRELYILEN